MDSIYGCRALRYEQTTHRFRVDTVDAAAAVACRPRSYVKRVREPKLIL